LYTIDRDVDELDLENLTRFIELHIRWEEREFFQYLESNLSVAGTVIMFLVIDHLLI
jgi:hypothetical protein